MYLSPFSSCRSFTAGCLIVPAVVFPPNSAVVSIGTGQAGFAEMAHSTPLSLLPDLPEPVRDPGGLPLVSNRSLAPAFPSSLLNYRFDFVE